MTLLERVSHITPRVFSLARKQVFPGRATSQELRGLKLSGWPNGNGRLSPSFLAVPLSRVAHAAEPPVQSLATDAAQDDRIVAILLLVARRCHYVVSSARSFGVTLEVFFSFLSRIDRHVSLWWRCDEARSCSFDWMIVATSSSREVMVQSRAFHTCS